MGEPLQHDTNPQNLVLVLADILSCGKRYKQTIDGMRKFVQKSSENWPVSGNVTKNVLEAVRLV